MKCNGNRQDQWQAHQMWVHQYNVDMCTQCMQSCCSCAVWMYCASLIVLHDSCCLHCVACSLTTVQAEGMRSIRPLPIALKNHLEWVYALYAYGYSTHAVYWEEHELSVCDLRTYQWFPVDDVRSIHLCVCQVKWILTDSYPCVLHPPCIHMHALLNVSYSRGLSLSVC